MLNYYVIYVIKKKTHVNVIYLCKISVCHKIMFLGETCKALGSACLIRELEVFPNILTTKKLDNNMLINMPR